MTNPESNEFCNNKNEWLEKSSKKVNKLLKIFPFYPESVKILLIN